MLNAAGLTLPTFRAWAVRSRSMTISATSNAAAAEQVLTKAGFTKGSNGFFEKGGKDRRTSRSSDPAAYTDYAEDDSIVAQQMKAAGIDATYHGLSMNAWNADVADGDFRLTEHWSNGGLSPYNMYKGWLNSTLATGSAAVGDYERLNDPAINADLATLAGATTVSTAGRRPGPARAVHRGEPADHPGHHRARSGSSTTRRTTPAGRPSRTRTTAASRRERTTVPAQAPMR